MKIAKSDQKTDELQKKIEEATNNWKRVLADYQNLEKRVQAEKSSFVQFASQEIIVKLLPVLDTFDKLEEHLKNESLTLALKQFRDVLTKEGLEKIGVLGKEFDPNEMECVQTQETVEEKENKVIEETRAGYRLKGKVIRVALVKVGQKKVDEKAQGLAKEELGKGDYM